MPVLAATLALAALALATPAAHAQEPVGPAVGGPEVVDRVVAVVGDSVLLQSEVQLELLRALQDEKGTVDTAAVRKRVIDQQIDELVMLQAAVRDSLTAAPGDVQRAIDQDVAQRQQAFGGQPQFEAALAREGLTMTEFRQMLSKQYARTLVIQQYMNRRRQSSDPPTVTEEEIRDYFESHKAQLGDKPATISFRQIVLAPKPADSARAAALQKASMILGELRKGADFATLAKRYSDDPGTKEQGGDLGWFKRGQMLPAFENAAFSLPPGAVSGVVETTYGFHIIKVEKVRGGERQARHILIQAPISQADVERTRALGERLAQQIRDGASIDSLTSEYGDPAEQARVGPYPVSQLPAPYDEKLAKVSDADVVGPIELSGQGQAPTKFAIVKVTAVSPAGEYTIDDLRSQIRDQIQQSKMMDEIIGELRAKTYIDVRM